MPTTAHAPTAVGRAAVPLPKRLPGAALAVAKERYPLARVQRSTFTWFKPSVAAKQPHPVACVRTSVMHQAHSCSQLRRRVKVHVRSGVTYGLKPFWSDR